MSSNQPKKANSSSSEFSGFTCSVLTIQANTIKELRAQLLHKENENKELRRLVSTPSDSKDKSNDLSSKDTAAFCKPEQTESGSSSSEADTERTCLIKQSVDDILSAVKLLNENILPSVEKRQHLYFHHARSRLQNAITKLHLAASTSQKPFTNLFGKEPKSAIVKDNSEAVSSTAQVQSDICDVENEDKLSKDDEDEISSKKSTEEAKHIIEKLKRENYDLRSSLKEIQLQLDKAVSEKLHAEEKVNIYKDQIADKTRMIDTVINMQKLSTSAVSDNGSYLLKQQLKTFEDDMLSEREEKKRIKEENENIRRQLSTLHLQLTEKASNEPIMETTPNRQASYANNSYTQNSGGVSLMDQRGGGGHRMEKAHDCHYPSRPRMISHSNNYPPHQPVYNQQQQRYHHHQDASLQPAHVYQQQPQRRIGFSSAAAAGNNCYNDIQQQTSPQTKRFPLQGGAGVVDHGNSHNFLTPAASAVTSPPLHYQQHLHQVGEEAHQELPNTTCKKSSRPSNQSEPH